jgi:hypothetical protein
VHHDAVELARRDIGEQTLEGRRAFLLHQIEVEQLSYASYRQVYAALKFLYSITLARPGAVPVWPALPLSECDAQSRALSLDASRSRHGETLYFSNSCQTIDSAGSPARSATEWAITTCHTHA